MISVNGPETIEKKLNFTEYVYWFCRGNSRYHYYGIRLKPSSTLNQLMPDETPVAMRQPTHPQRRVVKSSALSDDGGSAPVTPKVGYYKNHKVICNLSLTTFINKSYLTLSHIYTVIIS